MQQDGKLIGVISHVSALKTRISTQILVTHLKPAVEAIYLALDAAGKAQQNGP